MSKIRMITFHTPKNYGAVLQAFSLMSYLKNLSDDVKVIDYNTPHLRSLYPLVTEYNGIKGAVKKLLEMPTISLKKEKYARFEKFVQQNLDLTQRYESTEELMKHPPEGDFFVTGSDQVFGPNRISEERKAFYLSFVPEGAKRISYAGSFGCSTVAQDKKEEIRGYLSKFDSISVREPSGATIVKDLCGREAEVVLDPVFLNDRAFWECFAQKVEGIEGGFLLYYRLMSNRERDEKVLRIAKERGLRVMTIAEGLCHMPGARILRNIGPAGFLWLYSQASFVATDSFHGVAFSLIFEKPFVFMDENPLTRDRGLALLKTAGIAEKAYSGSYKPGRIFDYSTVWTRLEPAIAHSRNYLKQAVI